MIEYNQLAAKHYAWVEAMGWHNKTVLEALALIASEVGEVAMECTPKGTVTVSYGEELADIVLRTMDLAHWQGLDIDGIMNDRRLVQLPSSLTPLEGVVQMAILIGKWVNTARQAKLPPEFSNYLGDMLALVESLAQNEVIDLHGQVLKKMEKNLKNGTRGRKV